MVKLQKGTENQPGETTMIGKSLGEILIFFSGRSQVAVPINANNIYLFVIQVLSAKLLIRTMIYTFVH